MSGSVGIAVRSVSVHYRRRASRGGLRHDASGRETVRALDGVTFDIDAGTSIAITGPSGCGKSTLLAVLAGLVTPTEGDVTIGAQSISLLGAGARARLRRRTMGLVFQSDALSGHLTAAENLAQQRAMAWSRSEPGRASAPDAEEMLARVALADHADRIPDVLSGGERQRVAIARALAHGPQLLLADEPTGSLDESNAGLVADLLVGLQRDSGVTLVVVTHDPAVAARFDRTIRLEHGRVVADRRVVAHGGDGVDVHGDPNG